MFAHSKDKNIPCHPVKGSRGIDFKRGHGLRLHTRAAHVGNHAHMNAATQGFFTCAASQRKATRGESREKARAPLLSGCKNG